MSLHSTRRPVVASSHPEGGLAGERRPNPAIPEQPPGPAQGLGHEPRVLWLEKPSRTSSKGYGRQHDLVFVPEYEIESPAKERRYVDGALLHELRVPFGYWEAKDEKDDLDAEIAHKFKRGYPQDNMGPPILELSRPLASSAESRIISAGMRKRGPRASSRL